METSETPKDWYGDTWNNLVPRLKDRRDTWLMNIEQAKQNYPDDDFADLACMPLLDKWLWQIAVAEAMRRRPQMLAFHLMLSHATIHLPYGEAEVWVEAVEGDSFTVRRAKHVRMAGWDVTPIGAGNAEQTADMVVTSLR